MCILARNEKERKTSLHYFYVLMSLWLWVFVFQKYGKFWSMFRWRRLNFWTHDFSSTSSKFLMIFFVVILHPTLKNGNFFWQKLKTETLSRNYWIIYKAIMWIWLKRSNIIYSRVRAEINIFCIQSYLCRIDLFLDNKNCTSFINFTVFTSLLVKYVGRKIRLF